MTSEARKKKRRALNRRRKRERENNYCIEDDDQEDLQQQSLTVKKLKQESTLSLTVSRRESCLSIRSNMGQITGLPYSDDADYVQSQAKAIQESVAEAEKNLQQQRLTELPENYSEDAQQNLYEQRLRDIEKERRDARLRLDQIRPTVVFDELSRCRELMKEFGFTDWPGL